MSRALDPGQYPFDRLHAGDFFETDKAEISSNMILTFADLTGDHFEIHLSDAGAQKHGFPAQVAHGLLVLSVVEGLKSRARVQLNSFAALGWEWSFKAPVFAQDSVQCRVTLLSKRSAGPKSGLLTLEVKAINQHGQTVQQGQTRLMVHRR